ncbi:hypothetical protein ACP2W0_08375 [Pseudobacillus badius]|uniref:hypothetical protein n=1 Tax=Bacillus badius TaxID=1455 RepID=UPI003CF77B41
MSKIELVEVVIREGQGKPVLLSKYEEKRGGILNMEKDMIDWQNNVRYVHNLMQQAYLGATAAIDTLSSYEDDKKYHMSLAFLTLAEQSYLEAKRFYQTHENIERIEFDELFRKYEEYKFELMKTISDKDKNTSWLHSRYETLKDSIAGLNQLVDNIR